MPRKRFKTRDKKINKITKDGLIEVNQTQGTKERISSRLQDVELKKKNDFDNTFSEINNSKSRSKIRNFNNKYTAKNEKNYGANKAKSTHETLISLENKDLQSEELQSSKDTVRTLLTSKKTQNPLSKNNKSATLSAKKNIKKLSKPTLSENNLGIKESNKISKSSKLQRKLRLKFSETESITPKLNIDKNLQSTVNPKTTETIKDTVTTKKLPQTKVDKRFSSLEKKATKSNTKLDKAKKKLPKRKVIIKNRIFNEETKKGKTKLYFETKTKTKAPPKDGFVTKNVDKAAFVATGLVGDVVACSPLHPSYAHSKIHQVEKDNSGVESAHKSQKLTENSVRGAKRFIKSRKIKPYKKVAKLEKHAVKANTNYLYQKALRENPKLAKSNPINKIIQKQMIKKKYAKAYRTAKKTKKAVSSSAKISVKIATTIKNLIIKNKTVIMWIAIILLILGMLSALFSTISMMMTQGVSYYMSTAYLADDREITKTDEFYSDMEVDLQLQINDIPNQYAGYNEYRYNIGDISHSPFELMAYLTTMYEDFNFSQIQSQIRELFNKQYSLTITPSIEVRYRTETSTDSDGNETTEEVPYDWYVLTTTLTVVPFRNIAEANMTDEQLQLYDGYVESTGNRQYFTTPINFDWLAYATIPYGYYIDENGEKQQSKGVTLTVPQGTEVKSMENGIITEISSNSDYGNYVVIDNENNWRSLYGYLGNVSVSEGQEVKNGDVIGTSTNQLYLEIQNNGEYLNPVFFADRGNEYFNGGPIGIDGSNGDGDGGYIIPPEYFGDDAFAQLMEEAQKYIGYSYVWGGSNPSTSFDCSGFVCWSYTQSGVYNLPRTTAQGIYNQCIPVSPSEAKAGDLIFFTDTYSSASPVTHVGIYVGNGMMLAAGDPIGYADVNSAYWQGHFYSFGRLN